MNNNKRTFEEFLKIVYNMTLADYYILNDLQKKALECEYKDKYGTPIIWY